LPISKSAEGFLRAGRSREGGQVRTRVYEVYEEKTREVYRPRGLLAYATAAREYVRVL
jgi:hypothetical protein